MTNAFKQVSDAMAEAVKTTTPALVTVNARRRLPATGVVWSADGVIVTAHHVVERDDHISVVAHDGTEHSATLIGRDPHNDLAVLKVDGALTAAAWGTEDGLQVGNLVLALGKPGDQTQATLGVVSAIVSEEVRRERRKSKRKRMMDEGGNEEGWRRYRRRRMYRGGYLAGGYIQTDVTMYPGFSGGPLVNGDGLVYGLNTSGFRSGASIAVPLVTIQQSVTALQAHGKVRQGYLGVGVQPVRLSDTITESEDQETGLLIVSIEKDSPADSAGLMVGDILLTLADDVTEQVDELLAALTGERVGQSVTARLVRGGEIKEVAVTIAERA